VAGNSKHKRRVKLKRASKEVKAIEQRRADAKQFGLAIERFGEVMESPIGQLALAAYVVRRVAQGKI
jgi:hypothetical protein